MLLENIVQAGKRKLDQIDLSKQMLNLIPIPTCSCQATIQSKLSELPPWYLWIGGGTLGAFYVVSASYIGPKLGFGFYFVVVITGQLSASLVLDHIEFLHATPRKEITGARLLGCLLAVWRRLHYNQTKLLNQIQSANECPWLLLSALHIDADHRLSPIHAYLCYLSADTV